MGVEVLGICAAAGAAVGGPRSALGAGKTNPVAIAIVQFAETDIVAYLQKVDAQAVGGSFLPDGENCQSAVDIVETEHPHDAFAQ